MVLGGRRSKPTNTLSEGAPARRINECLEMESAAQAARADANALRPIFQSRRRFCQLLRALPPPLCHQLQLQKGNIVTFQLFATLQVTKVLLPGGPGSISASPAPDNVSWREYSNQTWIMAFASKSAAQVGKSKIPAAVDVPLAKQVFDSSLLWTAFQFSGCSASKTSLGVFLSTKICE